MFCCRQLEYFSLNKETNFEYSPKFRDWEINYKKEYGGGGIKIDFCPWCGSKLPLNLVYEWFEETKEYDDKREIPQKYKSNQWYANNKMYLDYSWFSNIEWNKEIEIKFKNNLKLVDNKVLKTKYLIEQSKYLLRTRPEISAKLLIDAREVIKDYDDRTINNLILELLGSIYLDLNNFDKAERYFRELYYKNDFDKGSGIARSGVYLIKIILTTNQRNKYLEAYEIALRFDLNYEPLKSDKFECLYLSALLCLRLGKIEESKRYAIGARILTDKPKEDDPDEIKYGDLCPSEEQLTTINKIINT